MKKLLLVLIAFTVLFGACGKKNQAPGEKMTKIAFLYFGPDIATDVTINGYLESLKEAGYVEGKNLEIVKSHAGGEISNILQMVKNADNKGYDLIVPMSTPVLTAAAATVEKTKVVFVYTYDPVGAGVGKSFTEHLPNFTGVGSFPPIEDTWVFFQKVFPQFKKIGTIYNSSEANSVKAMGLARQLSVKNGYELIETTITGTNEATQAVQALISKNVDFIYITGDNTALQAIDGIISMATKAKIPIILNDADFVDKGALAAVGIGWFETGKEAGRMAVRVLKGEDPKNIAIVNFAPQQIIINSKVVQNLGLAIPEEILKQYEIKK